MTLTFLQTMRRISQQFKGWGFDVQEAQVKLIAKLYARHGLDLRLTSIAMPEQYEVFKEGQQVAYYRLRHGGFTVRYPDHSGKAIYSTEVWGDGTFYPDERLIYLTRAMRIILKELES